MVALALAASVALTLAALSYPSIALHPRQRSFVLTAFIILILLTPLLVPLERPFGRFLAAIIAISSAVKLYDLHVGAKSGYRPSWRSFNAFLLNISSVVLRKLDHELRPGRRQLLARLARAFLHLAFGLLVLIPAFRLDWRCVPFAIEHVAKVLAFFLTLVPAATVLTSLTLLLGGRARALMDNPFAARTPADFWRRYNRPAQQFFYENIFKPLDGLRSPLRATLACFAVSAIIHEYIFDIATGRIQGYQTVFFLLQGCAVAATERIKPRGWQTIPWNAGTLAFNLATSVLFFASLNEVVPFYSGLRTHPDSCS